MRKAYSQTMRILLSAGLFMISMTSLPAVAQADGWHSCRPTEVIELVNRIHVRCSNPLEIGNDQIRFFAVSNEDSVKANRFTLMAQSALLSGKFFRVFYRSSPNSNTGGCAYSDCRTPVYYGVMN